MKPRGNLARAHGPASASTQAHLRLPSLTPPPRVEKDHATRGRIAMLAARRLLAPTMRAPPAPARAFASRKHKKFVKLAKGYRGRTNCFRIAVQRVEKAWQYAFRDRKVKKREMRKTWIRAINAGSREHGVAYNRLICGLRTADIDLNRKVLADLAISEPRSFAAVVAAVRAHEPSLAAHSSKPAGPLDGLEASRYRWFYDQRGGGDDELEEPPAVAAAER